MMLKQQIAKYIADGVKAAFQHNIEEENIMLQPTRKEFEGTYTFVTFTLTKEVGKKPEEIGELLGTWLESNTPEISGFNVVKGFLNLVIAHTVWVDELNSIAQHADYGKGASTGNTMMVEYSSPNTNKPLHLGHLRNNFLGYSVAEILKEAGNEVVKTQIINDRGIHICKSMLAWQNFGDGEEPTPEFKGDKLVGKYYVKYSNEEKIELEGFKSEIDSIQNIIQKIPNENIQLEKLKAAFGVLLTGLEKDNEAFKKGLEIFQYNIPDNFSCSELSEQEVKIIQNSKFKIQNSLFVQAQEMLQQWENNNPEVRALWQKMNRWVYDGFDVTYKTLGVDFDKLYYESDTFLVGRDYVLEGLKKGVFFQKEDGSVWVDLTDDGMDEKLLLRSDGTSVYMTQDIGTAILRFKDYPTLNGQVYTVGNEQDYHFKVLFLILKKLGFEWAENCYHLSYGMVDLPSGKMKSREGTVVDADDLVQEMIDTAQKHTEELGKIDGFNKEEAEELYRILALGALKFFLLKVDPKKRMLFNPEESIEFQGHTGPFIQYTHARISAILRKAAEVGLGQKAAVKQLHETEVEVIEMLVKYPEVVQEAATHYSPALMANYVYDLAKAYNRFYSECSIFSEEDQDKVALRVQLSSQTARMIKRSMALLGADVPERM